MKHTVTEKIDGMKVGDAEAFYYDGKSSSIFKVGDGYITDDGNKTAFFGEAVKSVLKDLGFVVYDELPEDKKYWKNYTV